MRRVLGVCAVRKGMGFPVVGALATVTETAGDVAVVCPSETTTVSVCVLFVSVVVFSVSALELMAAPWFKPSTRSWKLTGFPVVVTVIGIVPVTVAFA